MHKKTSFTLISLFLILTFLLAGAVNAATLNQTGSIADVTVQRDSVEWQINLENSGAILTVALPDGTIYQQAFVAGDTPAFSAGDVGGSALGDGLYQYELEAIPVVDDEVKAILASAASSLDRAAGRRPSSNNSRPKEEFPQTTPSKAAHSWSNLVKSAWKTRTWPKIRTRSTMWLPRTIPSYKEASALVLTA